MLRVHASCHMGVMLLIITARCAYYWGAFGEM
jgi:hypothetical protein